MSKPSNFVQGTLDVLLLKILALLCAASITPQMAAQQPQLSASSAIPRFEIISVKPNNSGARASSTRRLDDGIQFENVQVDLVVRLAYQLDLPEQIINLPDWTRQAHYDMQGRVVGADVAKFKELTLAQKFQSAQQVLAERFKLTVHHEVRQLPVYELVLATSGSKGGAKATGLKPVDASIAGEAIHADPDNLYLHNGAISALAAALTHVVQRTVVDKTGLTGRYDVTLRFRPDSFDPAAQPSDGSAAPSLFTAVQEELGLKLVPAKGPVDCIVIDSIQQPSVN